MARSKSITLQQFYQEFIKFTQLEELRWEANDKRFDSLEKAMRKMDKKFDKLFDFLDKEVMEDCKRIDRLEAKAGIITPS